MLTVMATELAAKAVIFSILSAFIPGVGLGGGAATGSKGYMPQDLGYWEFGFGKYGELYSGVDPLTGKLVHVKSKKRIRYGDVPRTVLRSRTSGSKVSSDTPYYKKEYVA